MDRQHSTHARFRVAVLASGRGSNLGALLHASSPPDTPFRIVQVLSDNPEARALELASNSQVPTAVIERRPKEQSAAEFNRALVRALEPYQPQLVVLAGFMRVLTAEFISVFEDRLINIHPSLLPSFPGLHAQRQALEAGVRFTGCTVHLVTERVDAGPIIAQAVVPVLANDTEETLAVRILAQEHKLLPAVVSHIARGNIRVVPGGTENNNRWQIRHNEAIELLTGSEALRSVGDSY